MVREKQTTAAERDMAQRALEILQGLDINARLEPVDGRRGQKQPDMHIRIGEGRGRKTYAVEIKKGLRPATLGPIILRGLEAGRPVLLITDYATTGVAELLRQGGVAFVDMAGNAYLDQPGLKLYVTARKPEGVPREKRTTRAFLPAGLRVLFLLLCDPERAALTTRELAGQTGVANGTAGRVLQDLRKERFLYGTGRRRRRLIRLPELLDRWVAAYPGQLRPQVYKGRFQAPDPDWWKTVEYDKEAVMLGGEPAADRLTRYLKPGMITLYVRGPARAVNEFLVHHRLRRDPGGDIDLLQAFWPADLPADGRELVPTPLVYADLMATGDIRCIETAGMIYDQYLAGRYRED